jgi:hypothetical protein
MSARIYQQAKNPMQSGRRNMRVWILEYAPSAAKEIDPLMGWVGSRDMQSQVRLKFASREEAEGYATREGLAYVVAEPKPICAQPKNYADNFRYDRVS